MPFAAVNGTRLYYRLEGAAGKPVLMLSHSVGADHGMWAPQMPDFLDHFQVLRYDTRGHGASDVPPGEYSMEQLGRDALGLADALNIGKFAFCGLSLGGMIAQWLATNARGRLIALVLANTSPRSQPPPPGWEERRRTVLEKGMAPLLETAMQRWFLPETVATGTPHVATARVTFMGTDPIGYAACCAAIRDVDYTPVLGKIKTPTLVIGGDRDIATTWAGHGDVLAREISGAQSLVLGTAHLSNVDQPRTFTTAVIEFVLAQTDLLRSDTYRDPKDAGFVARRAVLGDVHVDRSMATATDFNRDFQELITRYAWGSVWARPGLDRRTRKLLVMAITSSLGRWEEFRLHLRAALEHGMEPSDLKEMLLQAAVYAGAPVGNTGFQIAIEEIGKLRKPDAGRA
jgi:3-oxoadipate enol-lactonase/4-carboxymuconolactone decarboxylase